MKKYTLALFVFILFVTLLGFNVNSASAVNCASGDLFNTTTGQACGISSTVVACPTGDLFSSTTGQRCTAWQDNSNSSDLTQFNNLFKSNFKIGLKNNNDVRALQQFLKDQGYYFGKIDGSYGKISVRAVKDFQDDNDLTNTTTPTPVTQTPTISGLSSTSANIGETIYVYGSGFNQNSAVVTYSTINGSLVSIGTTFISSTTLSFPVPSDLGIGLHSIKIQQNNNTSIFSNAVDLTFGNSQTTTTTYVPTITFSLNGTNGDLSIASGTQVTFAWSSTNAMSCVMSGVNAGPTGPTSGTYTGTPTDAGSYPYTVVCTGAGGSTALRRTLIVTATSIVTPFITISSPNGGPYQVGSVLQVNYSTTNLGNSNINIDLVNQSGAVVRNVVSDFNNSGVYTWIPSSDLVGTQWRMRVSSVGLSTIAFSPYFYITAPTSTISSLSSVSANAGETIYVYGSGFNQNSAVVTYSTTDSSLVSMGTTFISSTALSFIVPSTLGSGLHSIKIQQNNDTSILSNEVDLTFNISQTTQPSVTCTLYGFPSTIQTGSRTTLSWTTSNATSLTIDNGIGSIPSFSSGSGPISPAITTTYTGTATGVGGSATCSKTIIVSN